jgi:hypothetical protein
MYLFLIILADKRLIGAMKHYLADKRVTGTMKHYLADKRVVDDINETENIVRELGLTYTKNFFLI